MWNFAVTFYNHTAIEIGVLTVYDDFVTSYRERGALQSLQKNKHGLVYGLVYIRTRYYCYHYNLISHNNKNDNY